MKPYLTVTQVAEREGLSTRRVRILCEEGRVYYADKVGGQWLIQLNYRIDKRPSAGRPKKKIPKYPGYDQSPSSRK